MRLDRRVVRAVVVPYVVSRAVVIASLAVTRHVLTSLHVDPAQRAQATLLGWDAGWYRDIAHAGYPGVAREGLRFFPLFPLAARLIDWLPGVSAAVGVVVVANAFALALGFAVHALVMQERHDARLAARAVWLVYVFPAAYVLVMGYAEAMFMTAAAIALLAYARRWWWLGALAGLAAGLTRPVGVLLAVPAAIEAVRSRDRRAMVPVVAPAVGAVAYLSWAERRSHDFLYPLRVQQDPTKRGAWVDPFRAVWHAASALVHGDHVSAGIHAAAALVFAALLVVLFRRWRLSFAVYAAVALVAALSSHNLDSLERYGLATVPFMLAAADLLSDPAAERAVLVASASGLAAASVLAFTGVMVP